MRKLYVGFLIIILAACAAIGSVQPVDFNDRLTSGYSTVSVLRDITTQLLLDQHIGSTEHKKITDQLETARFGLDAARGAYAVDPHQADTQLTTIRNGLKILQAYLIAKGK